jgi:DNA-binding transcriptional ArsR family regulator
MSTGSAMAWCTSATAPRHEQTRQPSRSAHCLPGYRQRLTGKSLLAYPRRVSDLFKALADDTRRKILDELIERDGQTLFEICSRLAMKYGLGSSRQAISQHLEVLESAGLVTSRREGRYKFHFINTKPLEQIVDRWLRADTEETR